MVRIKEAVRRLSPPSSTYLQMAAKEIELLAMGQIAWALRADYQSGYLNSIGEIIRAEVFADFLDASAHLLDQGHKDPAAVLIGGVLENHLRQLSTKNGLSIKATKSNGQIELKNAETLYTDLRAAGVYGASVQKHVTSMLAIRNLAAHANYGSYDEARVKVYLAEVRNFLNTYPA